MQSMYSNMCCANPSTPRCCGVQAEVMFEGLPSWTLLRLVAEELGLSEDAKPSKAPLPARP